MSMIRPCINSFVAICVTLAVGADFRPAAGADFDLDLGGGVKLTLVLVPRGTFTEGSPASETGRADTETERRVTISHDFFVGKYPVTVGQFKRFVMETGHRTDAEIGTSGGFGWDGSALVQRKEFNWKNPGFAQTDEHPVTIVTYLDAQAFVIWLSRKSGRQLALPTEAEWEYACRAGTTTPHYGGTTEQQLGEIGWYKANAGDGTRPVGQKKANAYGLYDMSGNVFEWCRDWSLPRTAAPATDPEATLQEAVASARRVLRGGSWMRDAKHLRSAARYQSTPGTRNAENGFRLVATAGADGTPAAAATARPTIQPTPIVRPSAPQRPAAVPGHQPDSHAPSHSGGSERGGIPIPLIIGALVVGVIVIVFIAKAMGAKAAAAGGGGSPRPAAPGLTGGGGFGRGITTAPDGFWFEPQGYSAGDLLIFSYLIDGLRQQQNVRVLGGNRQYIFTGREPTDVRVEGGSQTRDDDWNDAPVAPIPPSLPPRRDDSPFRGHPGAY
jgi:sulfatase modifying factor 1